MDRRSIPDCPSVGDLFYAMLASVACGMFAYLVREAVIDTIHHGMGVRIPAWDFSRLQDELGDQLHSNSTISTISTRQIC